VFRSIAAGAMAFESLNGSDQRSGSMLLDSLGLILRYSTKGMSFLESMTLEGSISRALLFFIQRSSDSATICVGWSIRHAKRKRARVRALTNRTSY
jgi:hypothetical protein